MQMPEAVYRQVSQVSVLEWHHRFKNNCVLLEDDPSSGGL